MNTVGRSSASSQNDPLQCTPHASFRGLIGIARTDITPPVGIYARNWGAAQHDVAESIHRPLTLTALTLARDEGSKPLVLIDADLGWWRSRTLFQSLRSRLLEALSLESASLIFALTHTHAGAALTQPDASLPGSELLADYLEQLVPKTIETVTQARRAATQATLDWHTGHCQLAKFRDLPDPDSDANRIICGYNPSGEADTTLLLGRVTDSEASTTAVLVNYACHPTTLAWENRALSPDFVGAMRETIENHVNGAQAVFLQGASGELAPRHQYVGDTRVADRHGRQLGFAALATLEDMDPPATQMVYDGVVESGAPLATWSYKSITPSTNLRAIESSVELPLKDWPSSEVLAQQRTDCDDRALEERLRRRRDIRRELGDGASYALPLHVWSLGDAVLVGTMAEAYSTLQTKLRKRFPNHAIIVMNLINGSIGYLPPAELYDADVYQVEQTPFARGGLEAVVEELSRLIQVSHDSDPSSVASASHQAN